MTNKNRLLLAASLIGSLALAAPAFAQTNQDNKPGWGFGRMGGQMGMEMHRNGVVGTVASVSGNTLTVTSKDWSKDDKSVVVPTIYTVDATNAKVTKNNVTSTVANIAVGDTVMIQGTVNGTAVVATTIRDGMMPKPNDSNKGQNPVIQGNGQPVIAGTVNAINGNTLTVGNPSKVTYTVDATNATVNKNNATSNLASVVVGDNVVIQGAFNGTNVTASSIIDHAAPASTSTNGTIKPHSGFFGSMGNFFKHLFGF